MKSETKTSAKSSAAWWLLLAFGLIVFFAPVVIFTIVAFAKGLGLGETFDALIAQLAEERNNLLMICFVGLIPMALLGILLGIFKLIARRRVILPIYLWFSALPILLVNSWANLSFWPSYLPERVSPGFPHGLEFVIAPLIFAPIAFSIGLLMAWLLHRQQT